MKKVKKLQKKACAGKDILVKSEQMQPVDNNPVRMTAKLRSKLKNIVSVGQGLWRVFNSKGDAYYCQDPILLADTVYRRKYDEVLIENLNGQYMNMYKITGRKQK